MKVNIKMPKDIPFKNLDYGDVFYAYSSAYIKITPYPYGDNSYNAVNLSAGSLDYFDDGKLVNKLDSELNAKLELVVSE